MQIAIRELKASLSRVLALAQSGTVVEVTSRRRLVARITGIAPQVDEDLRAAVVAGRLSWRGGKPQFTQPLELSAEGKPVGQMVLEDRG